ncbi:MAG: PAS domain S-box protein [Cyanobacteria bacterium SIG26]|nr:PAS domain S-box protein [Cyanobacteria bacterium SIG26]
MTKIFRNKFIQNIKTYFLHYLLYLLLIFFFCCSESESVYLSFISKQVAIVAVIVLLSVKIWVDFMFLRKNVQDNSMLRELINHSPLLSYVLSPDGKFLFGNARAERFFNTGVDITLDGEHIDLAFDKLIKQERKEIRQILLTGECLKVEKPLLMTNGEYSWYLIHKIPLKDKNGKIYAITNFSRNIDAEKRIQDQRETYIATLTHDLKTPTIAQVRALELLLSGQMGEFNPQQEEILKLTLASCNYMYDMVYTLLSTCKIENGSFVLNYEKVEILGLVNECIHELSNLAKENLVNIKFSPQIVMGFVDCDRIEIKRVIINLLSNAINYAFKNSTIVIELNIDERNFQLEVINSSPYIDSEIMSGLFRKYVSHSAKFNKVGIGLGLYLSKKIVEAHQGQIVAKSSKNQSNTFGFILPRYNPQQIDSSIEDYNETVFIR